jgi:hypothetical protein
MINLEVCIGRMFLYLSPPELEILISIDGHLLVIDENNLKETKQGIIIACFHSLVQP